MVSVVLFLRLLIGWAAGQQRAIQISLAQSPAYTGVPFNGGSSKSKTRFRKSMVIRKVAPQSSSLPWRPLWTKQGKSSFRWTVWALMVHHQSIPAIVLVIQSLRSGIWTIRSTSQFGRQVTRIGNPSCQRMNDPVEHDQPLLGKRSEKPDPEGIQAHFFPCLPQSGCQQNAPAVGLAWNFRFSSFSTAPICQVGEKGHRKIRGKPLISPFHAAAGAAKVSGLENVLRSFIEQQTRLETDFPVGPETG